MFIILQPMFGSLQPERQPGKSDSDRSLGSDQQKYKRLKTTDSTQTQQDQQTDDQQVGGKFAV